MTRVKRFRAEVRVSGEFMAANKARAEEQVWKMLANLATEPFTGPRGGRYEPITGVYDVVEGYSAEGFIRNERWFGGSVDARYVRPKR
jgi:Txe/YoeB family toxin of Txe-Axe toxin-antitoxin module